MESAKIRLSAEELALIKNADWILTKNAILAKVNSLLASLQDVQKEMLLKSNVVPDIIKNSTAKISRGENYEGLPWQILDYPRLFDKENTFAIRTMFWWGNYFSCTLHLSGEWKSRYEQTIMQNLTSAADKWFVNYRSEWDHRIPGENYENQALAIACADSIRSSPFIKLAGIQALENWNDLPGQLAYIYQKLLLLLKD